MELERIEAAAGKYNRTVETLSNLMATQLACEQEHSQKDTKKKGQEKYAPTDVTVGATNKKYDYVDDGVRCGDYSFTCGDYIG